RTLFLRVREASANAMQLATHFSQHPLVAEVLYPGLPTNQGHEVARRQMEGGFGGMLSIRTAGGEAAAIATAANTRLWKRATALGGVESLIEHPAIMTHASVPPENRKKLGIDDGLIRVSVGIEDIADLTADLKQALDS
ncbi:MAG TPA: PLP-dependent transferase, partial [Myxococcota bacterium]